ncbi:chorismate mutase [Saccharibacillus sp. CPCC 101409]|uniref:chorismate mutase n=1 Tax=Saccharibacillus sp. CPCC 101409 TaxID=3058041 RepID=UPI002673585D|nr:chorismate mutase [Saccharibacillus sp. CPCC 101409]MDO3409611.1 chorismate mutase [Saccharibacillus sp. CPCC 101409]
MYNRGIRGATTVEQNDREEIYVATEELAAEMIRRNAVDPELVSNVWITVTHDLDAAFPAVAIRKQPGWDFVPLMCAMEIPVEGSLPRCIRLMIQVNTGKGQREIQHVYQRGAVVLRPDLAK